MIQPIRVEGLAEFNKALRKIDSDLPKLIRTAGNDAATVVVDWARPRVPRKTGRAARSLRVASTRTASRVRAGGARVQYYPWLDFGGRVGRNRSVARPFHREGRYLWKGLAVNQEKFQQVLSSALNDVVRSAGLEVD